MEKVPKKVSKLSHRAESGRRFALRSLYVIGPEPFLPTVLNPITFRYRQRGPRNIDDLRWWRQRNRCDARMRKPWKESSFVGRSDS